MSTKRYVVDDFFESPATINLAITCSQIENAARLAYAWIETVVPIFRRFFF